VLISLCRPALSDDAFVTPATPREIAGDLVVSEAAVKQHLLRLYQKFGLVRPLADFGSGQVQHAHGVAKQPPLDGMEPPAH
jgi:hypothetical protein